MLHKTIIRKNKLAVRGSLHFSKPVKVFRVAYLRNQVLLWLISFSSYFLLIKIWLAHLICSWKSNEKHVQRALVNNQSAQRWCKECLKSRGGLASYLPVNGTMSQENVRKLHDSPGEKQGAAPRWEVWAWWGGHQGGKRRCVRGMLCKMQGSVYVCEGSGW